jgi:WD40 repeat protein
VSREEDSRFLGFVGRHAGKGQKAGRAREHNWGRLARFRSTNDQPMKILKAHPKSVIGLVFSPDGRYLVSASNDSSLFVHDSANDYQSQPLQTSSAAKLTYCHRVAFSAEGRHLISFDATSGLHVWNVANWSLRATFLRGQTTGCTPLASSPTAPIVLATSWMPGQGMRSHVWDLTSCQETLLWPGNTVHLVAFDPTGTLLTCGDGVIRDVSTGNEIPKILGILAWIIQRV